MMITIIRLNISFIYNLIITIYTKKLLIIMIDSKILSVNFERYSTIKKDKKV